MNPFSRMKVGKLWENFWAAHECAFPLFEFSRNLEDYTVKMRISNHWRLRWSVQAKYQARVSAFQYGRPRLLKRLGKMPNIQYGAKEKHTAIPVHYRLCDSYITGYIRVWWKCKEIILLQCGIAYKSNHPSLCSQVDEIRRITVQAILQYGHCRKQEYSVYGSSV